MIECDFISNNNNNNKYLFYLFSLILKKQTIKKKKKNPQTNIKEMKSHVPKGQIVPK